MKGGYLCLKVLTDSNDNWTADTATFLQILTVIGESNSAYGEGNATKRLA
jgi:hypothetical protein